MNEEASPEGPGTNPNPEISRPSASRRSPNIEQITRNVSSRIDNALLRNRVLEILIAVILLVVAVVGIFLLLSGASTQRWELLASGSACALAVGWPVSKLVGIREANLIIQILPDLIRMADTKAQKELVIILIKKLIDKI